MSLFQYNAEIWPVVEQKRGSSIIQRFQKTKFTHAAAKTLSFWRSEGGRCQFFVQEPDSAPSQWYSHPTEIGILALQCDPKLISAAQARSQRVEVVAGHGRVTSHRIHGNTRWHWSLGWRCGGHDTHYEWLGGDDDGFAAIGNHALQPDVVVENKILEIEPVEVFGRSGPAAERAEGNAITQLAFQQSGLEITLSALVKINLMLATTTKFRRQAAAPA